VKKTPPHQRIPITFSNQALLQTYGPFLSLSLSGFGRPAIQNGSSESSHMAASRQQQRPTEHRNRAQLSCSCRSDARVAAGVAESSQAEVPRRTSTLMRGRIRDQHSKVALSFAASTPRQPAAPVPWPFPPQQKCLALGDASHLHRGHPLSTWIARRPGQLSVPARAERIPEINESRA